MRWERTYTVVEAHAGGSVAKVLTGGIVDARFTGGVTGTARVGGKRAIRSSIAGQAWITAISQYGYDPSDPFPEGFTLSATWLQAV